MGECISGKLPIAAGDGVQSLYVIDVRIHPMVFVLADNSDYWKRRWSSFPRLALFLFVTTTSLTMAQSVQFLPELDTSLSVSPVMRATFQVKQTREGGDPTQMKLAPA